MECLKELVTLAAGPEEFRLNEFRPMRSLKAVGEAPDRHRS